MASVLEWGCSVGTDPCVELGMLVWPLRRVCWVLRVQLPPYRELGAAVPHAVPHPTHSTAGHNQVSLLLPLFIRDEL